MRCGRRRILEVNRARRLFDGWVSRGRGVCGNFGLRNRLGRQLGVDSRHRSMVWTLRRLVGIGGCHLGRFRSRHSVVCFLQLETGIRARLLIGVGLRLGVEGRSFVADRGDTGGAHRRSRQLRRVRRRRSFDGSLDHAGQRTVLGRRAGGDGRCSRMSTRRRGLRFDGSAFTQVDGHHITPRGRLLVDNGRCDRGRSRGLALSRDRRRLSLAGAELSRRRIGGRGTASTPPSARNPKVESKSRAPLAGCPFPESLESTE